MKKRLFAVLMAVCLVMSTCVLFASAAQTYKEGALLLPSGNNYKVAKDGTDYDIPLTVEAKNNASIALGTKTLSADQIDDIFTFKSGNKTLKYKGDVENYLKISSSVEAADTDAVVTVTFSQDYISGLVEVTQDIPDGDDTLTKAEAEGSIKDAYEHRYDLNTTSLTANVKLVAKLYSVTTGVRFFGSSYNNLVAAEIAKVTTTVNRADGKGNLLPAIVSSVNKVEDLMVGSAVTVETSLKDPAEAEFYEFYCWVDGSGTVISTDAKFSFTVTGSTAIYAAYRELKNRFTITYSAGDNGSIVYTEGREIFKGDGIVSVMEGKNATFTFVPDEGYEVAKVLVNGKNIASLSTLNLQNIIDKFLSGGVDKDLSNLINATNKETYFYTFENVTGDNNIEVTFQKINVLEPATGKDLPTVAPEGITLATGVAGEAADGNGAATTVPAEDGAANSGAVEGGVVNPQTGSASAIALFAVLSVAAGAAFVTAKKKD